MDHVARAKIEALLLEIRSWRGHTPSSAEDIARRHQLDPLLVVRVAEAEGICLPYPGSAGSDELVDPNQSTLVLHRAEVLDEF